MEQPDRNLSLSLLRQRQRSLGAIESSLSKHLSDVKTSLQGVNAQIAQITVTNNSSPLYSLPNEILMTIFDKGLRYSENFAILASHITRHLREVAIGSPTLWRRIRVHADLLDSDKASTYLRRSKGCLLDIKVVTGATFDFTGFEEKHEIHFHDVFLHTRRWRSLQIIERSNAEISRFLRHLAFVPVPRLEKLSIQSVADDDEVAHYMVFAAGAPMLSNVKLTGMKLSLNSTLLPMMAVTTLYIAESSFSSYNHMFQFLRAAPLLADLTLAPDGVGNDQLLSSSSRTTLSIPTLLTFEILDFPEEVDYLCDLCAIMITPALQCLKLSEVPLPVLASFAERLRTISQGHVSLYPALRSLHLCTEALSPEVLENLTHSLPDITNITIWASDDWDTDVTALALLCDDGVWKHLNTITIENFDETNDDFMAIICHIIAFRESIHHLFLHSLYQRQTSSPQWSPHHDTGVILGDIHYGIAWLRERVILDHLNVCTRCDEGWDSRNKSWIHECIVE